MLACEHDDPSGLDDVEQRVWKPSRTCSPHIAFDPLIEQGMRREDLADSFNLVEERPTSVSSRAAYHRNATVLSLSAASL
jgi:hypothetical protein